MLKPERNSAVAAGHDIDSVPEVVRGTGSAGRLKDLFVAARQAIVLGNRHWLYAAASDHESSEK